MLDFTAPRCTAPRFTAPRFTELSAEPFDMAEAAGADPQYILRRVFGFASFRGLQADVVQHVIDGGDALVLMPTGGGKSLCYQVPALCRAGVAVVVSPLIALMDDQVAALRQLGVRAGALHSDLDPAEARRVSAALSNGALDLLYVSPERLLSNGMIERLSRLAIGLIAIDEAHCVSQWGHEFRPEYRLLACLPEQFPGVPRIALTATADRRTQNDILSALAMPDARAFAASFHRPNLHIAAVPKVSEMTQLQEALRPYGNACGIVYCGSRAKTERVAARLTDRGMQAVAFHAGLLPEQKRAAASRFRSGEPVIVVATIAFGMGIDRPDVRTVVHLDMPDSPEAYYQQIGRAGRDGETAHTLLLYGGEDIARARHFLAQSQAPDAQLRAMRARLEQMIALTETTGCRTRALLACFGEAMAQDCGHCDNCAHPPVTFDGTEEARKALSAIFRTGQRFGAIHVVAVLRGETTDQVIRYHHDKLPVFGLGKDRGAAFWRGVIRQLIARGAVDVDSEAHGALVLVGERARPILRNEERVELRDAEPPPPAAARGAGKRAQAPSAPMPSAPMPSAPVSAEASGPFEALRQWRLSEAKAQGVPPYVIFHDSVLREVAAVRPATLDALGQIKGVGASKLERYGAAVLAALRG
jgi:ATP-dependent DNA helicase RecQ